MKLFNCKKLYKSLCSNQEDVYFTMVSFKKKMFLVMKTKYQLVIDSLRLGFWSLIKNFTTS